MGMGARASRASSPLEASPSARTHVAVHPHGRGAADPDQILEVSNLRFSYGQVPVLFGVDLNVHRGEALALLGTNGAGKSTVLRCIAGLAQPSNGRVVFEGSDITQASPPERVRRGLVLVSGGRSVFPDLSVRENLQVGSWVHRRDGVERDQRIERVMLLFPQLQARVTTTAGRLSGGEQQQLAIAKALLLEPKLLCIDELSLGLAPVIVESLLEVVRDIAASGTSLILVEQSLNIAAQLCSRALFLEKGEVKFEGHPRQLLEREDIARAVFFAESEQVAGVTT